MIQPHKMKPTNPRHILSLSSLTSQNSKTIKNIALFSQSPNYNTRRRDEDNTRGVGVSVWWDFENCNLPCDTNVFRVAQCVTNAVRANGIKGPIQITAFGDVMQMSKTNQIALSSTGINIRQVPSGGKNSADRSILVDLMFWVSENPPPAHLFLISGDRDFAGILHRLRMNNYNILLASPDSAPSILCSAATIMWQWNSLLKGEKLSGKLFNQPPDGPYGSWYGHFRGTLENPFPEQPSCLPVEESAELASDWKPRPIPKAVMKHIRQILQSNPEGISIGELRADLKNSDLTIDKDFYGYSKFARFLSAMPHVLKLHPIKDGQFLVTAVNSKFLDKVIPSVNVPATTNGNLESNRPSSKSSGQDVAEKSIAITIPEEKTKYQVLDGPGHQNNEKLKESSPSMKKPELNAKAQVKIFKGVQKKEKEDEFSQSAKLEEIRVHHATELQDKRQKEEEKEFPALSNMQEIGEQDKNVNLQDEQNKVEETSPIEVKEIPETNDIRDDANNKSMAPTKIGFVRKILNWWFGPGAGDTDSSKKLVGGGDTEEINLASKDLISPFSHESLNPKPNMSKQTTSCAGSESEVGKNAEKVDLKQLELFSKEGFWHELGLFMVTSRGSDLIFQSTTREHLAENLQKLGPLSLSSLAKADLLHLVDLLISDKKWLEEYYSQNPPFKLTLRTEKDPPNNISSGPKELSNIFSITKLNSRELGVGKHQNPPHAGVPQHSTSQEEGASLKSRSEILNDCQKLVDHITANFPDGFRVKSFRKLFLKRHGYSLDLQKLGYGKLVNLLHILPGMKLESDLILPGGPSKSCVIQPIDSDCELVNNSSKDGDSDCIWDELGPADVSGSKKEEIVVRVYKTPLKLKTEKEPDYELIDEDDFSGSDEEESGGKPGNESGTKEEDSSLLQILDSWYESKEEDKTKDKIVGISKMDGADAGMVSSPVTGVKTKNDFSAVRLQRTKRFSFVAEEKKVNNKDTMIDGILNSLKNTSTERSGESKLLS